MDREIKVHHVIHPIRPTGSDQLGFGMLEAMAWEDVGTLLFQRVYREGKDQHVLIIGMKEGEIEKNDANQDVMKIGLLTPEECEHIKPALLKYTGVTRAVFWDHKK